MGGALVLAAGGVAPRARPADVIVTGAVAQHGALIKLLRDAGRRLASEADTLEHGVLPSADAARGDAQFAPVATRIDRIRFDLALAASCVGGSRLGDALRAARAFAAGPAVVPAASVPYAPTPSADVACAADDVPQPAAAREY